LAFIGALHLGKRLLIADRFFENLTGLSRIEYLQKYGERALQQQTVRSTLTMLQENQTDCVIECGISSLGTEVQKFLAEYKKSHPVIYILREPDEIKNLLRLSEADSNRLRAEDSKHRVCANYEYYNVYDSASRSNESDMGLSYSAYHLNDAKLDFCHFMNLIVGPGMEAMSNAAWPSDVTFGSVEKRQYSYAPALRLSELSDSVFEAAFLGAGLDAIRLIVDMKEEYSLDSITNHIALLRRAAQVPIVYEVLRPRDDSSETNLTTDSDYLQLLSHGIRNCAEYIMIDLNLPEATLRDFISLKTHTKIIGSHHDDSPGMNGWRSETRYEMYQRAQNLGCHLVQLTQAAVRHKDNDDLIGFTSSLSLSREVHLPLIAYNTGPLGRSSLVFNKILTPVRPAVLHDTRMEDYITAQEAIKGLFATFIFDSLKFYHIGASVSWSPYPPAMHKAAYHALGLQHSYQVFETASLETLDEIARAPEFGGASISLPFKASILASIDFKSTHATAIGAINTLLPIRDPLEVQSGILEYQASQRNQAGPVIGWYGDNTDWLGILECVQRNLSPRNTIRSSKTTALVIGAGGAARAAVYALIQMGCRKIAIFNRTFEHAEQVAAHFNAWVDHNFGIADAITVIQSISEDWPARLQPATIIVSCIPAHGIGENRPADLTLPGNWLRSKSGGVVADVSTLKAVRMNYTNHNFFWSACVPTTRNPSA
jgi:shikimate 5-dehydrogenase/3-dehydroquinate dehydratase